MCIPGKYMAFHRVYDCPSYVVKEYALFQMIIHRFCKWLKVGVGERHYIISRYINTYTHTHIKSLFEHLKLIKCMSIILQIILFFNFSNKVSF